MARILLNVKLILIMAITFSIIKIVKTEIETEIEIDEAAIEPRHYDVRIKFDLYKNVFFGECNITIEIISQIKTITIMNSQTFAIFKIDLINIKNQIKKIPKLLFYKKQYIHLNFGLSGNVLSSGTYILRMMYVRSMLDAPYDGDFLESSDISEKENKV